MAETVEFTARIKNGIIKLPKRYKALANAMVKIILQKKEAEKPHVDKDNLIRLIVEIQEKGIFNSIKDPLRWQKEQRDEWD